MKGIIEKIKNEVKEQKREFSQCYKEYWLLAY